MHTQYTTQRKCKKTFLWVCSVYGSLSGVRSLKLFLCYVDKLRHTGTWRLAGAALTAFKFKQLLGKLCSDGNWQLLVRLHTESFV